MLPADPRRPPSSTLFPTRRSSDLIDRGKVTRGWIGVALEPLSTELAQALGLRDTRGAVVARVYPGSPAAVAGLAQNDVIVTFDRSEEHTSELQSRFELVCRLLLEK